MNQNQIVNIITTILQPLLALLVSHGYFTSSQTETIGGAVAIILVFIVSHVFHAEGSSTPPASGAGKVSGLLLVFGFAVALVFGSIGCASANSNIFSAEDAAAVTADAGMRSYALYWQSAIQNPAVYNTSTNTLLAQRAQLESASQKIGASIALAEGLRSAYTTNSALEPQLDAAVSTLTQNAAAMVQLVAQFESVTNGN